MYDLASLRRRLYCLTSQPLRPGSRTPFEGLEANIEDCYTGLSLHSQTTTNTFFVTFSLRGRLSVSASSIVKLPNGPWLISGHPCTPRVPVSARLGGPLPKLQWLVLHHCFPVFITLLVSAVVFNVDIGYVLVLALVYGVVALSFTTPSFLLQLSHPCFLPVRFLLALCSPHTVDLLCGVPSFVTVTSLICTIT